MTDTMSLVETIKAGPHWRVVYRPEAYVEETIPSLGQCSQIIEKNAVRLRGWDFPHVSHRPEERTQGTNWVSSHVNFLGHQEYWRFYQSSQFIYLGSVREAAEDGWHEKLLQYAKWQLADHSATDWANVPGFFSFDNFVFTIVEICEFAARLCQAQVYSGNLNILVSVENIQGFMLTADMDRHFPVFCVANASTIGRTWTIGSRELLADSPRSAYNMLVWFFERLGWLNPSPDVLMKTIDKYMKRQW